LGENKNKNIKKLIKSNNLVLIMFPLIFLGISSFLFSFAISKLVTSEILKNRSKVKFNQIIRIRYIPSIRSLSYNTISNMWYNQNDLKIFKHNYLFEKKYYIILTKSKAFYLFVINIILISETKTTPYPSSEKHSKRFKQCIVIHSS